MANPNIVNVTTIEANNSLTAVTTVPTAIINNPASSGKVYKINTVIASNIDATNLTTQVDLDLYSQDDLGGTAFAIIKELTIPSNASVVIIDKGSSIYLKEDQSLGVKAVANSDVQVTAFWEEIS